MLLNGPNTEQKLASHSLKDHALRPYAVLYIRTDFTKNDPRVKMTCCRDKEVEHADNNFSAIRVVFVTAANSVHPEKEQGNDNRVLLGTLAMNSNMWIEE